jgi:hypothetical protein
MRAQAVLLTLAILAACGGSSAPIAEGSKAGTGGGTGGGGSGCMSHDGGGCIAPTEGEPCYAGDVACQPCNPCCSGLWTCDRGSATWHLVPLYCPC